MGAPQGDSEGCDHSYDCEYEEGMAVQECESSDPVFFTFEERERDYRFSDGPHAQSSRSQRL